MDLLSYYQGWVAYHPCSLGALAKAEASGSSELGPWGQLNKTKVLLTPPHPILPSEIVIAA